MTSKLEDDYFEWLKTQTYDNIGSSQKFEDLFQQMHEKEFVWIIPNDDNRIEDALDLRREFLGVREAHHMFKGVSVLEVLVSLSRRMAFAAGDESNRWAWQLIKNLGLSRYSDPLSDRQLDILDAKLEDLIWRNYDTDGRGGFFPLRHPEEDQTKVELWYQMSAYINEIQEP